MHMIGVLPTESKTPNTVGFIKVPAPATRFRSREAA